MKFYSLALIFLGILVMAGCPHYKSPQQQAYERGFRDGSCFTADIAAQGRGIKNFRSSDFWKSMCAEYPAEKFDKASKELQ